MEMYNSGSGTARIPSAVFFNLGVVCPFLGVVRASDKIFIISSIFYISYTEPLFVAAKIIASPGKNDSLLFHSKLLKCGYDHCSTVAFGNT